ncbi:MAG: YbgF trimerization domain-containing protein [Agitococcus sp.]|nr:YbgF trimerization domain-containing protein [Agitococcus sp.]
MYKISAVVLAVATFSIATSYGADIVIEEKSLSAPIQVKALPTTQPLQSQAITADTTPSMQWQIYQQVQQLQQEVRDLRGQLEVQGNIIDRMKQDARSRYLDLDQRITQLKNTPPVVITDTTNTTTTTIVTPPATTDTTVVAAPNPDDEKRAYFAAYEVFKTGGPNKAINPMRNFIKNYPHSSFTPSAYYWLGEFYLAASPADVANAKKSFKIVSEQYADTPKAAAALLKLGSFADVDGKTQEAIKYMLLIVKNFPNTPEANAAKSYLSAQNVPIPVEKVKVKTDTTKATTTDTKPKTTTPGKEKPVTDEKAKAKTTEKAKTAP